MSPLAARETALIKINPDPTISEIDPNIYSSFLEPLGNRYGGVAYGPLYDPKSPFSDENGFRNGLGDARLEDDRGRSQAARRAGAKSVESFAR